MNPEVLRKGDPRVIQQTEKIHERGVQVEWVGCRSFLEWPLQLESAVVQAAVQVAPHVLDIAMKYVTFL